MRRLLPAFVLLATLGACAHPPADAPPLGQLRLEVPLTIPPGAATVRLQYGRVTAFNAVQEQDPFCVFEIETVGESAQAVAPVVFPIVHAYRSVETFAGMPVSPWAAMHVDFDRDDMPSQIYYKTTFRLGANPQGARSLACMSNQRMPGIGIMRHLSLGDMRAALGGHFRLELDGAR